MLNFITVLLCILIFTSSLPGHAFIVQVTQLNKGNQRIFLLGDIHNLETIKDTVEQTELLIQFLKKLDNETDKSLLLLEEPHVFSEVGTTPKISNWKLENEKLIFDLKITRLDFSLSEDAKNLERFRIHLEIEEMSYPVDKLTTMTMLLKSLSDFKFIEYRSYDPRLVLFDTNKLEKLTKNPQFKGALPFFGFGEVNEAFGLGRISESEKSTLLEIEKSIRNSGLTRKWIKTLINEPKDAYNVFNNSTLANTMDIGALTEILAHKDSKSIVIVAGCFHTRFLRNQLVEKLGFNIDKDNTVGVDLDRMVLENTDYLPSRFTLESGRYTVDPSSRDKIDAIGKFFKDFNYAR